MTRVVTSYRKLIGASKTHWQLSLFLLLAPFINPAFATQNNPIRQDLTNASLEELMNVKISTVFRKPQTLQETAAAVFVISQEDIRRSSANSIPELLRMAPGLSVARIDSNKWSVTSRGYSGRFADDLLVMIDGRTVYSPLFAGTFWETLDLPLEDIDRIEVIRGPGGTIWGANAVNGAINIITKHTKATQGNLITTGGGSEERGFATFRHGGRVGESFFIVCMLKDLPVITASAQAVQTTVGAWEPSVFGLIGISIPIMPLPFKLNTMLERLARIPCFSTLLNLSQSLRALKMPISLVGMH